ncbi:VacJ family lipoprotein [Candidatus Pelagibacter sp.]|nr:VacJ family lipoprotein [Candidatus Pelagibacter sp.]|tara:strand:+ start:867 stop:1706 length:840 start_codon:yes stop_codon:yes gene_type:complete
MNTKYRFTFIKDTIKNTNMYRLLITLIISLFVSVSSMAGSDGENELSKNSNGEVKDCFETINRGVFAFNQVLDNVIVEPLAKGYRYLPSPIRTGTSNALNNLSLVVTIPNNLLQGEITLAGKNTGRFIINSTIGILGFFDPASKIGLNDYEKEDWGQTLGTWGVGEGCYIVLPILGPSTVRDTVGSLANYMGGDAWYNITVRNDTQYVSDFDYYASVGTTGIDFRAKNIESFDNLEKNSLDFYASVKSLYLQDRRKKIANSDDITETMNDSDWDEIETQ